MLLNSIKNKLFFEVKIIQTLQVNVVYNKLASTNLTSRDIFTDLQIFIFNLILLNLITA